MKQVEFCTSFAAGSDQFNSFIDTWLEHNFQYRLHVFYEGGLKGTSYQSSGQIVMHSLDEDLDRSRFLSKYSHMPTANGRVGDKTLFQYQATKFCHKVFAQSFRVPECEWWCWLDGDVQFTKKFDGRFFEKAFPDNCLWSTLDRKHLPETGFVGWKVGHPVARASLDAYRNLYASGEVFKLKQWDDCWAFRYIVRNVFSVWAEGLNDLCEGLEEQQIGDHPWPNTVLGEYMIHNKGPQRKEAAA